MRKILSTVLFVGLTFTIIFHIGCDDEESAKCEKGDIRSCRCFGGGTGVQACLASGSWEFCSECTDTGDGGADGDADGDVNRIPKPGDSGSTDSESEKVKRALCEAGETQSCECTGGGEGAQMCLADGSWGDCACLY